MIKRVYLVLLVICLCISNLLVCISAPQNSASWGTLDLSQFENINWDEVKLGNPQTGKTWMGYNINDLAKAKTILEYPVDTKIDEMDFVILGAYEKGHESNEKVSLRWTVLEKQNDKALLLSQDLLYIDDICQEWDMHKGDDWQENYNKSHYPNVASKQKENNFDYKNDSDIDLCFTEIKEYKIERNNFITNELIKQIFNQDELSYIIDTDMTTKVNKYMYVDEWADDYSSYNEKLIKQDTENISERNKIFQLSVEEYDKYLKTDVMRQCKHLSVGDETWQTIFYESRDYYISNRGFYSETRNPDIVYDAKTGIKYDDAGKVCIDTSYEIGYRPAIWVKLSNQNNEIANINNANTESTNQNINQSINQNVINDNYFNSNLSAQILNVEALPKYDSNTRIKDVGAIKFGTFYNSNIDDYSAIEWVVIEKDELNKKALLLSKDIIGSKNWTSEEQCKNKDVIWETSSIRKWLNGEFYQKYFTSDEKKSILNTHLVNNKNTQYNTNSGKETDDKVFLLSVDDIEKYFNIDNLGKGNDNRLIAESGLILGKNEDGKKFAEKSTRGENWWLRTIGEKEDYVADITNTGRLRYAGFNVRGITVDGSYALGTRPAIWVSYDSNMSNSNESNFDKINSATNTVNSVLGDNFHIEGADVIQNPDGSIQIGGTAEEGSQIIQKDSDNGKNTSYINKNVKYNDDQVILNINDVIVNNSNFAIGWDVQDGYCIGLSLDENAQRKYRLATERNLGTTIYVTYNNNVICENKIEAVYDMKGSITFVVEDKELGKTILDDINSKNCNFDFVEGELTLTNENNIQFGEQDEIDRIIADSNEATFKKPIDRVYYYAKHDVTNKTVTSINKKNSSNGLLGTGLFSNKTYYNIEIKFNEDTKKRLTKYAELEWNGSYKSGQDWVLLAGNTMNDLENVSWFGITPFKDSDRVANTKELSYYQKGTLQVHLLSANEQNRVYNKLKNAKVIVLATHNVIKDDRVVFSEEEKLGNVERFEYVKDDGSHINLVNAYLDCEDKIIEYTKNHNGNFLYVKDGFSGDLAYYEEIVSPKKECNKFEILVFGNDSLSYSIYGNKVNFLAGKNVGGMKKFEVCGGKMWWEFELDIANEFEDYETYYLENKDKW